MKPFSDVFGKRLFLWLSETMSLKNHNEHWQRNCDRQNGVLWRVNSHKSLKQEKQHGLPVCVRRKRYAYFQKTSPCLAFAGLISEAAFLKVSGGKNYSTPCC